MRYISLPPLIPSTLPHPRLGCYHTTFTAVQIKNEMSATTCNFPDCLLGLNLAARKLFKPAPECSHHTGLLGKPESCLCKKTFKIGLSLSNFCSHKVFFLAWRGEKPVSEAFISDQSSDKLV